MTLKEIIAKTLPPLVVWLGISFLLIYSGNGIFFSGIAGAFGALPFVIYDGLVKNPSFKGKINEKTAGRISFLMNVIWLVIFLYTMLELFEITSSEVILTVMILILIFSKWKETAAMLLRKEK